MSGAERIRSYALIVLFADLTAVAARISLPLPPVPLTLQTMAVILSGALLGSRSAALSQAVYLAMGLAGLPVFAAGGGPAYLLSPTFGYLAAFPAAAWIVGRILEAGTDLRTPRLLAAFAAGILVVYAVGLPYLYWNLRFLQGKDVSYAGIVKAGLLLTLPGDAVKLALAVPLAKRLRGLIYPLAGTVPRC